MKFNATRRKSNTKMSDGGILWPQKETFFIFGFGPKKKKKMAVEMGADAPTRKANGEVYLRWR